MVDYIGRSALSELISDMGVEITNLKKANEKLGQENNWLQQDVRGFFNGDISLSDMWDKLLALGERLGVEGKNSKEIIDGVFDAIRRIDSEDTRLRGLVYDLAVGNREQNETIENLHKDNTKAWDCFDKKHLEVADLKKQVEELTRQNKILNENLDYARRHIEEACAVNLDLYKENEQLEKENSLLMDHNQEMIGERAKWLETPLETRLQNEKLRNEIGELKENASIFFDWVRKVAHLLKIKHNGRETLSICEDITRFATDATVRADGDALEIKYLKLSCDRANKQLKAAYERLDRIAKAAGLRIPHEEDDLDQDVVVNTIIYKLIK
jgi:chromosome segregation ATPase